MDTVENKYNDSVPKHLRDAHYSGAKEFGHGVGYKYPHMHERGYVQQDYLPDNVKREKYYIPSSLGYERKIQDYLKKLEAAKEDD